MTQSWADVGASMAEIASEWRADRPSRQARRHLERADFDRLRDAGLLLGPVPVAQGGLWQDMPSSTRPMCGLLRTLAAADPSVALVSSMHPSVLAFWLVPSAPSNAAWNEQRDAAFASAADGAQWGTITSEPGSGGDISRTKAVAVADAGATTPLPGDAFKVTGDKHFGSGSGVTDFMMTTAVPAGEDSPTIFVLDMRSRPWDGSAGVELLAEWDGMGMAATQSHAMRLSECPATRFAWEGPLDDITPAAAPLFASLFSSVVLGVLDEAMATARQQLGPKAEGLRAYERVEWARAELEHWLAVQAFEGALAAVESGDQVRALHGALRAKQGIAELAESSLLRLTRVIGGGTYARRSPFSAWFEDVRALGFLRPPWGLAFDNLFATSFLV